MFSVGKRTINAMGATLGLYTATAIADPSEQNYNLQGNTIMPDATHILETIVDLCDDLNLTTRTRNAAMRLVQQVSTLEVYKESITYETILCCIFVACREENQPRTFGEIFAIKGVSLPSSLSVLDTIEGHLAVWHTLSDETMDMDDEDGGSNAHNDEDHDNDEQLIITLEEKEDEDNESNMDQELEEDSDGNDVSDGDDDGIDQRNQNADDDEDFIPFEESDDDNGSVDEDEYLDGAGGGKGKDKEVEQEEEEGRQNIEEKPTEEGTGREGDGYALDRSSQSPAYCEGSADEALDSDAEHPLYGQCPWGCWPRGQDCECTGTGDGCWDRKPDCNDTTKKRPKSWYFSHHKRRNELAKPNRVIHPRPKTAELDVEGYPCTKIIPFNAAMDDWVEPCSHRREREQRQMQMTTLRGHTIVGTHYGGYQRGLRQCESCVTGADCGTADDDDVRMVCEDHVEDAKKFWQLNDLHSAHRVGTCRKHKIELMKQYRDGLNTCTCHRLFDKWQCRRCFERQIDRVQHDFRRRVRANHQGGGADESVLTRDYHLKWAAVRKMLEKKHPCSHLCGRRRLNHNIDVMDCRACGGLIIRPIRADQVAERRHKKALRRHRKAISKDSRRPEDRVHVSLRSGRGGQGQLLELDGRGRPERVGSQPLAPLTPPAMQNVRRIPIKGDYDHEHDLDSILSEEDDKHPPTEDAFKGGQL